MKRTFLLLTFGYVVSASVAAHAQTLSVVDAQARFEDGLDRARRGDNEGARIAFVQAYAVLPRAEILWNLALAEQRTGHVVEALRHFRVLDRDQQKVKGASDKGEVRTKIDELAKLTGHLQITAPAGSRITVDGEVITEEPPLVYDVTPGYHAVDDRVGDQALHQEASPAAGETIKIAFVLPPAPPPLASDAAPVQAPHKPSKARVVVPLVMLGVSALAAAGGVFFAAQSSSDADHAATLRAGLPPNACNGGGSPTCAPLRDTTSSQSTEATVSDALYIGAGAVAVSALALYLLWPSHSEKTGSTWVAPHVGAHSAGFDVGARF